MNRDPWFKLYELVMRKHTGLLVVASVNKAKITSITKALFSHQKLQATHTLSLRDDLMMLQEIFKACLSNIVFTTRWRGARVMLLSKRDKLPGVPHSYKPLCLFYDVRQDIGALSRNISSVIHVVCEVPAKCYQF